MLNNVIEIKPIGPLGGIACLLTSAGLYKAHKWISSFCELKHLFSSTRARCIYNPLNDATINKENIIIERKARNLIDKNSAFLRKKIAEEDYMFSILACLDAKKELNGKNYIDCHKQFIQYESK